MPRLGPVHMYPVIFESAKNERMKEWKKEKKKERKKEREEAYPNIIRDPPKTRHPDKSMKKAPNFVIWKIEFKIYLVNKIKVSVILNISLNSLFAVFRPNFLWFRRDSKAPSP